MYKSKFDGKVQKSMYVIFYFFFFSQSNVTITQATIDSVEEDDKSNTLVCLHWRKDLRSFR
jgi:hypothetical protein